MKRTPVQKVKFVSSMSIGNATEIYKEIGAAVECNDGKAKTIVWERGLLCK